MTEVWLRPNRRVLLFALVPVGIMGGIGYWLQAAATTTTVLGVVGWGVVGLAVFLCVGLIYQCYRPRIAFRNGHVLFYLRTGRPISVPVDVVEAFFLGQGAAHLPATAEDSAESMNLVARLSQREEQWQRRDVKPALGRWCEGYVTIRGTWCEPLTGELIRRLNRRLREVKES